LIYNLFKIIYSAAQIYVLEKCETTWHMVSFKKTA